MSCACGESVLVLTKNKLTCRHAWLDGKIQEQSYNVEVAVEFPRAYKITGVGCGLLRLYKLDKPLDFCGADDEYATLCMAQDAEAGHKGQYNAMLEVPYGIKLPFACNNGMFKGWLGEFEEPKEEE